jgi:uncharacterized repeat protein (TIGR03843 family)
MEQRVSMPPDKLTILTALQDGELQVQGQFVSGSNYTFMVSVHTEQIDLSAVYKPRRGEQPLWDFPAGTLSRREVAAYELSELLGWELVPPTIYRRKGPLGAGSLQQYIEHDPEYHYFNFSVEDRQLLRPVALFDLLINNADRKGGHILKAADNHLWLIDHGVCFHPEDKLRTVVWDFAGEAIPQDLLSDLSRLIDLEEKEQRVTQNLSGLLRKGDITALLLRARHLVDSATYPFPQGTRRSYPWPPV